MIVNLIHEGNQNFYGKYFDEKSNSGVHYNSLIAGIGIASEKAFTCSNLNSVLICQL